MISIFVFAFAFFDCQSIKIEKTELIGSLLVGVLNVIVVVIIIIIIIEWLPCLVGSLISGDWSRGSFITLVMLVCSSWLTSP